MKKVGASTKAAGGSLFQILLPSCKVNVRSMGGLSTYVDALDSNVMYNLYLDLQNYQFHSVEEML